MDKRTFRDVFPFQSGEDTRLLGRSLARRSGYFEIDEGNPYDDTDDVLSFTASVNIRLQNQDGSGFTGKSGSLSYTTGVGTSPTTNPNTFVIPGDLRSVILVGSHIWLAKQPPAISNNIPYVVTGVNYVSANTEITVGSTIAASGPVDVYLSESDPDFDNGVFGDGVSTSGFAEICYFLRNNTLYRRVLLIRDTTAATTSQPASSTGVPLLWDSTTITEVYPKGVTASPITSFWRDFDYSAFYFRGKNAGVGVSGICFHNASESLSNTSQPVTILVNDSTSPVTSLPLSLGIPNLRFGHSTTNGLPQDASTEARLNGNLVPIGRFTVQECSNTTFGFPGNAVSTYPFDRTDLIINPTNYLVSGYDTQTSRRGEDILMTNVLSFDVKLLDPNSKAFVDLGDDNVEYLAPMTAPTFGTTSYGRQNSFYSNYNSVNDTYHYRFDTWHPLATTGDGNPPFTPFDGLSNSGTTRFPVPLAAIQITINYRDVSSNQIRQVSIVQSLVDRVKQTVTTYEAPEE